MSAVSQVIVERQEDHVKREDHSLNCSSEFIRGQEAIEAADEDPDPEDEGAEEEEDDGHLHK